MKYSFSIHMYISIKIHSFLLCQHNFISEQSYVILLISTPDSSP
jgi:hypothetical protein